MTTSEFLAAIKQRGAITTAGTTRSNIILTSTALQNMRAAMLPMFMIELYEQVGSINLGSGYIFGPAEAARGSRYPIPSIIQINREFKDIPNTRGRTIFGRNDLFLFAFDAFGRCSMLDNLNMNTLREYDDPYRAMIDCLMGGKI